jgi:hypothetical protein
LVLADLDQEQAAVLDVGGQDPAAREQQGVVGVPEPVRTTTVDAGFAVAVDNPTAGDIDHANHEVIALGDDDLLAIWAEEGIVGTAEALPRSQVGRPRELPDDLAFRCEEQEPVVRAVGDQNRAR